MNDKLICGVDEVGRGTLFGRVYTAAVIWNNDIKHEKLIDSKKLSKKQRTDMRIFIEENAIDYCVSSLEHTDVDKMNILNATMKSMYNSIDGLNVEPELIYVDGNKFIGYKNVPHECVIQGDQIHPCISAASILAKVYHDEWIDEMCRLNSNLNVYHLKKNMGYGTKEHIDAINLHGPSKWHRSSFAPMKNM